MRPSLHPSHLHGLDHLLSVPSCAERVGIEICRMTGYFYGATGEVCLFGTEETPL
jgi:hypothetical protein